MAATSRDDLERVERWFLARGIPHFIHDYRATRDVFTRAAPLLTVVFVFEVVGAADPDWAWWVNALAVFGGLGVLAGGLAVSNAVRGLPALTRPASIGVPELSVFVVVPALLPLLFGGRLGGAAFTASGNVLLVGVVYVVTSFGVVPMTRWGLGRMIRQLGDLFGLLVRALPMLLLFVTFLFINAEVWQVSGDLTGGFFWATLGLFFVMGTVFVVARLPREIGQLARFTTPDEVSALARRSPAAELDGAGDPLRVAPLSRREWGNAGLVVLFSQGLQILLVTVIIGGFFVLFGLIAVRAEVIGSWTGTAPHTLAHFEIWDRTVRITEELLRVSGFLAAFSGLYFTVYAVTDATYRDEFYEDVVSEVREAFAARALYRAALSA